MLTLQRAHDTRRPRKGFKLERHSSRSGAPPSPSRPQQLFFDRQDPHFLRLGDEARSFRPTMSSTYDSTHHPDVRIPFTSSSIHRKFRQRRSPPDIPHPRHSQPSASLRSPSLAMTSRSPLVTVILAGSAVGLMAAPTGITSCYDSSAAPPAGYAHDPSNLVFTVDRTMEPSVGFTTEYSRFQDVKCDAPSVHAFTDTEWCEDNSCDSSCPISMPSQ